MRRNSLKIRLLIAVIVCEGLLAIGLLAVGRHYIRKQLKDGLDAAVNGRAISVAALVRYPEDNSANLIFDKGLLPAPLDRRFADLYEVIGPNNKVLGRSAEWPKKFDGMPAGTWTAEVDGRAYRGVRIQNLPILDEETGTPVSPAILTVSYATPMTAVNDRVATMMTELGAAALVLLGLSTLLAWWAVQRSLLPLDRLAERAGEVSARNWNFRPPESAEKVLELQPLINSLERMLGGLHETFEQQRDFIANAAHELKTPVAIQKSTLQLLLHRARTESEYREGVEKCLSDTERLEDLLQRLLRLARADQLAAGASGKRTEAQDVNASCEASIARLQPLADSRGVSIDFVPDGNAKVAAEADDLESIWSNLLENAIQYSPRGSAVKVRVGSLGERDVSVTVEDEGSGIEPELMPHIFERFFRGERSRSRQTGGIGLGLAIVKSLVNGYGGRVSVNSRLGHGSRFEVILPKS